MYFSLRNNRSVEIPSIFTLIKTKYLASYHKTKYTRSYKVYYNKYQKFLGENKIKYRMTASRKAGCSGILKWSVYQSDQKESRDRVNHLLSESCPPLRHTLVLTQQAKNLKTKIFNSKKSHKIKFPAEQTNFKNTILILPYFNKVYF